MRLVKPSAELVWEKDMLKLIEIAGRTCYKSEDKITDDSAKKFVEMLMSRKHNAMIEHGTIYLKTPDYFLGPETHIKYEKNPFSKVLYNHSQQDKTGYYYITTNYRVLIENNWLEDLQYQVEPTEHHIKRYTVKFICDRGVTHEIVRHRPASYAQESTRYCNYGNEKFGNCCTFIIPCWLPNLREGYYDTFEELEDPDVGPRLGYKASIDSVAELFDKTCGESKFLGAMMTSEGYYKSLLDLGWQPQQARAVSPNSLKTEIIMTCDTDEWQHFFKMRIPPTAHPQMRELTIPLLKEFNKIDANLFPLDGFGSLE